MTIEVTAEDICNGTCGDMWKCPIAQALWRLTGARWRVEGTTAMTLDRQRFMILPTSARYFVLFYDLKHHVQPFTFDAVIEHS